MRPESSALADGCGASGLTAAAGAVLVVLSVLVSSANTGTMNRQASNATWRNATFIFFSYGLV
jgi:hypothetical protein